MADIQLHNTLTGKIENFVSQKAGEVRMYTCGPTVYDYAHIGNYRTFVFQDILRRFLKLRGFKLNHVMNLTDVDDRIIANAAAAGMSIRDYTAKFVQAFFDDCKTLSIEEPEHWIRATDHIDDKVRFITASQNFPSTESSRKSISRAFRRARVSTTIATKKRARGILRCGKRRNRESISGRQRSALDDPAGTLSVPPWP